MPAFDLSDAFLEVSFQDPITVIRRAETVDVHGRSQVSLSMLWGSANVSAASKNDLIRLTDFDSRDKTISIITNMPLRTASHGFKPDIVIWNGDSYLIETLDDYTSYGPGWVNAIGVEMDFNSTPDGYVFGFGNEVGSIRGWGTGNWTQTYPAV